MDGHDADDVRVLRQDLYLPDVHLAAAAVERIDILNEAVQASCVLRFVGLRLVRQRAQIREPLRTCRDGGGKRGVTAVRQQLPQKIAQRHVLRHAPPVFQLCGEIPALFFQRPIGSLFLILCKDAVVGFADLAPVLRPDPDRSQIGRIETEDRRAQHAQQRNVLAAVVDDAQQVQEHLDLHDVEIALRALQEHGQTGFCQFLIEHFADAFHGAQQDNHVAVAKRPVRLFLIVPYRLSVVSADDSDGVQRLEFGGLQVQDLLIDAVFLRSIFRFSGRVSLIRNGRIDQIQLRRIGQRPLVGAAFHQSFVVRVFHAGRFAYHQRAEQAVDQTDDFLLAAEVAVQVDDLAVRDHPGPERAVLLQEQLRLRQAEFVDALLDVADPEHVVRAGDPADERLLDHIAVLILVDEDMIELFAVFPADFFILQDAQRKVFYI